MGFLWYNIVMKLFANKFKQIPSSFFIVLAAASLTTTVVISIITSPEPRWIGWSFSALGEGGTLSAFFFSGGVALSAIFIWLAAGSIADRLHRASQYTGAKVSKIIFRLMAYCLLGIALFPNDTMHEYHFAASRLLVLIFTIYASSIPHLVTSLSRRDYKMLYGIAVAAVVCCLSGYAVGGVEFVVLEGFTGFLSMVWLYLLCRLVERQAQPLRQTEERLPDVA